jgi:predicted DNA binding CopG/RHH family protein
MEGGIIMKQPEQDRQADGSVRISGVAPAAGKTKITINIDRDILGVLRTEAAKTGVPYQRLVNQLLRKALQKDGEMESRLERLERKMNKLKRKLSD